MKYFITEHMAESELAAMIKAACIPCTVVISEYDFMLGCCRLRVLGAGLNEVVRVPAHTRVLSIQQFADEVLAPFVETLRAVNKTVDPDQKL